MFLEELLIYVQDDPANNLQILPDLLVADICGVLA